MKKHYLQEELESLVQKDATIFEFLQSGSLDGVWYLDLEEPQNEWMSPRFWELLGYNHLEKKHLTSEWQDIIYKDDLKEALKNLELHLKDPSHHYDQQVRYRHKNGSTIWVRCRGIAIRNENGRPIRMLGAHNDITEIMLTKELLNQTLNSSLDGIMALRALRDDDGEIFDFEWTLSNDRACEIVKLKREEIIGKRMLELMPGNRSVGLFDIYKEVVESGVSRANEFFYEHDGICEWFLNKAVKMNDGFVVTFSVITDKKQKEQELEAYQKLLEKRVEEEVRKRREQERLLIEQNRLASMSELLRMIAHQWRQPLNVISLCLGMIDILLEQKKPEKSKILEKTDKASQQLQYLSKTIENFREFFNENDCAKGSFDVKDALLKSVELISARLKSNDINILYETSEELVLEGSETQFRQPIITVILNAKDAILAQRTLKTQNRCGNIWISAKKESGFIIISIEDDGIGLSNEVKKHLFEPYFSTKGANLGAGMGLYMAKTTLEHHFGGTISLTEGRIGALCIIKIPIKQNTK